MNSTVQKIVECVLEDLKGQCNETGEGGMFVDSSGGNNLVVIDGCFDLERVAEHVRRKLYLPVNI